MWLGTGRKIDFSFRKKKRFLLLLALIQYLIYVIFYQRFVEDRLINFIDLCSVSNISVFILTDNQYGYYIHGRSPHGTTDVNIRDMIMNLERESNRMSGTRGLQAKSDEQTFIVRIDRTFRSQYEILLRNYEVNKKKIFF
jgi:meckelin